jgi:hypothetical protein
VCVFNYAKQKELCKYRQTSTFSVHLAYIYTHISSIAKTYLEEQEQDVDQQKNQGSTMAEFQDTFFSFIGGGSSSTEGSRNQHGQSGESQQRGRGLGS